MGQMYTQLRVRKKLGTNAISEELGDREVEEAELVETEQTEEEPVEILEEKIKAPESIRNYEIVNRKKKLGAGTALETTKKTAEPEEQEEVEKVLEENIRVPQRTVKVPYRRGYTFVRPRKKRGFGFVESSRTVSSTHTENARAAIDEAEGIIKEFWETHKQAIETLGKAKLSFDSGNFEKALEHANSAKLLATNSRKAS